MIRFLLLAALGFAFTVHPAEDAASLPPQGHAEATYIVGLKPANAAVRTDVAALVDRYGGEVGYVYTSALRGYSARMTPSQADDVAADPLVASVERSVPIHATGEQVAPPSWGLKQIDNAPGDNKYAYPNRGRGVTVYVTDSHLRTNHTTFEGRASSGWDFVDDDNNVNDCYGSDVEQPHGTFVAGLAGGLEYGAAKKVHIVGVRILNCLLGGESADAVKAADWITAHAVRPAVVNASWAAAPGTSMPAVQQAINNSIDAGITWVIAAGNDSVDACDVSPSKIPRAITVAATQKNHAQAGYSNDGPCVDVYAPGTDVVSAFDFTKIAHGSWTGTSFAAPHVAGAAALFLSTHPLASPQRVRDAIVDHARTGFVTNRGPGSPDRFLNVAGLG